MNWPAAAVCRFILPPLFGLCFAFFSLAWISSPGLYYDECIFVNAALGGTTGTFIHKVLFGVPTMIMAYIGALKSWLYAPIFALFGVTPMTIRLPVVILTALTLCFAFLMARRLFGALLATLFVGVLATDPALIYNVGLDYGPVALMLFLKVASLYFFFLLIESGRPRYAWLLAGSLLLGIYDKLNFVWFVLAFGGAALLCYRNEIRRVVAGNGKKFLAPMVFFFALFLMEVMFLILPALTYQSGASQAATIAERVASLFSVYLMTMNGSWPFAYVFAGGDVPSTLVNYLLLPIGLGIGLLLVFSFRAAKRSPSFVARHLWFFAALFVLVSLQILVTKQAGGTHHMMMLYPFHHLVLFSIIHVAQPLVHPKHLKLAGTVVAVMLLALFLSNLHADLKYASTLQKKAAFTPAWDPAVYQLSKFLKTQSCDVVMCADWGLQTVLFSLADPAERDKYVEASGIFRRLDPRNFDDIRYAYHKHFAKRNVLVVLYRDDLEIVKNVNYNFKQLNNYLQAKKLDHRIFSSAGQEIYQLYYVPAQP